MSATPPPRLLSAIKWSAVFLMLLPLFNLPVAYWQDALGADPFEAIQQTLGKWTLYSLFVTLGVTPLRRLTGFAWLIRLRRALGLTAFAYACVHALAWAGLEHLFDPAALADDLTKRVHIIVGLAALILLTLLAITSTNAAIKRLGGKRWQALHRLVYAIAILGVVHHWLLVKADFSAPAMEAAILAILLASRLLLPAKRPSARGTGKVSCASRTG